MSEKDKKSKQTPEENAAAEQPVNETPEAAAEAAPETRVCRYSSARKSSTTL